MLPWEKIRLKPMAFRFSPKWVLSSSFHLNRPRSLLLMSLAAITGYCSFLTHRPIRADTSRLLIARTADCIRRVLSALLAPISKAPLTVSSTRPNALSWLSFLARLRRKTTSLADLRFNQTSPSALKASVSSCAGSTVDISQSSSARLNPFRIEAMPKLSAVFRISIITSKPTKSTRFDWLP